MLPHILNEKSEVAHFPQEILETLSVLDLSNCARQKECNPFFQGFKRKTC